MVKFIRTISSLFRKPIIFDDLNRALPVSSLFGYDRGTPIDRFYIERFLEEHHQYIKGNVLEISESTYSKKFDSGISSFEILSYDNSDRKATIIGDLTQSETIPNNKIDCFICTQTFNFIFDVQKAIEGSFKLLKPGGCLLATVSGISQISRYDMDRWGDYWRFTDLSIRLLMENVFGKGNVDIITYGNALAATAFLQGLSIEDLPNLNLLEQTDIDYQLTIGIKATKPK